VKRKRTEAENAARRARYALDSEHRKQVLEQNKKWRDANTEEIHARKKLEREGPKREVLLAKKRKYHHDNREAIGVKDRARNASPERRRSKAAKNKAWRDANPELDKLQKREWYVKNSYRARETWLKNKYGINHVQFDAMTAEQGGRCAICKNLPKRMYLAVDHDHVTGKVRKLLCERCNTLVGFLESTSDDLKNAALAYIKEHKP